jgi:hypothetical protein
VPARLVGLGVCAGLLIATPGHAATPTAQPGQDITIAGASCSAGFILTDARHHLRFLATAGHCVGAAIRPGWTTTAGDRLWSARSGPAVTDDAGATIGHVVFATYTDSSDFAVIALNHGVAVDPAIPHWGRVHGLDPDPAPPDVIRIYGQGEAVGLLMPARQGAITSVQPSLVRAAVPGLPGDSGCPVVDDTNQAIGLLVALQPSLPPASGLINVIRLPGMLSRASRALRLRLVVA